MNIEQNQYVKSSGILLMVSLVGTCLVVILFPWNKSNIESKNRQAVQKAEIVGYQVVQLYREALELPKNNSKSKEQKEGRSPASIKEQLSEMRQTGLMGEDPWGNSYHYRIVKVDEKKSQILVWSMGPNGKVDSHHLEDENYSLTFPAVYRGDDLGIVLSLN